MFGYIKPYENELKIRSLKLYRSVYCGLCKSAGKNTGIFSRFFLSYDYTFFAVVRMIFEKTPYVTVKKRCGFHLFSKKDVLADNSVLALSCAVFSVMTYYKLKDSIKDEKFFKALGARMLLPIAGHMRKNALKKGYSDVEMIISECMEKIGDIEKQKSSSVDEAAEAFGNMMGYLLKLGLCEEEKQDAYTVGFETGRFIYCADAADDLKKDEKNGNYNPYLNEFGSAENALIQLSKCKNIFVRGTDNAADILSAKMKGADRYIYELCEIALNILYLGCPAVTEKILTKDSCRKCSRKADS